MLAYVTGSVDQELLRRNEYLVAENRILRHQIKGRVRLSDEDRRSLAEIGKALGRRALAEVATVVKAETILAWHRRLVARRFDGSAHRKKLGRPRIVPQVEELVVQMAKANPGWGYDRLVGALADLGHTISDQAVGNLLKRHGLPRRLNGRNKPPGRNSFEATWKCWQLRILSRRRCGLLSV